MVSGPEIARLIGELESAQEATIKTKKTKAYIDYHHHKQVKSIQETFETQVRALVNVLETIGNPFLEDTDNLVALDTKELASDKVVDTVRNMQ